MYDLFSILGTSLFEGVEGIDAPLMCVQKLVHAGQTSSIASSVEIGECRETFLGDLVRVLVWV
jgi:hypothetical protein